MRRILAALLFAIIFALLWATAFSAELEQVWVQRVRYDLQQRQMPYRSVAIGVDNAGRIYSTHEVGQPGAIGISTTVHDGRRHGVFINQSIYRGDKGYGDHRPRDLVALPDGGCIVTGETYANGTTHLFISRRDWLGGSLWQNVKLNGYFSAGYALTLVGKDKVAVAGSVFSELYDNYYVALYDVASGRLLWQREFDGGRGGSDYCQQVVADAEGSVYVAGYTVRQGNPSGSAVEIVVAKLADDDGRIIWKTLNTHDTGYDYPHGLAVDKGGNAIVTGQEWNGTDYDMITVKYLSKSGARQWTARSGIRGIGTSPDSGSAVAVTPSGDVVVTGIRSVLLGRTAPSHGEFATACYSSATGAELWLRSFSSPDLTSGAGYGVIVDNDGLIWVTGIVPQAGQPDFYTAKLNDKGEVLAASSFDGLGSSVDSFTEGELTFHDGHKLALTSDGGVVVVGTSIAGGTSESVLLNYRYSSTAPMVTTGAAVKISLTSAVVNATVTGQGASGTAWIEWGSTTAYGNKGAVLQFAPNGAMTFNEFLKLSSMGRHVTYNFRAVASTDTGTVYGANRTFVTNTAPVATRDQYHCRPGEALDFAVLGNDSDSDGDSLSIIAASNGAHGTVTVGAGGVLTYTPRESFKGNDSFTYTIADGFGGQATATVSLVNDAPVANTDVVETAFEQSVAIPVMANDSDVSGDGIMVVVREHGKHGAVLYGKNGALEYIPDPEFTGNDSFNYELSDGWTTAQGTVTIRVLPPIAPVTRAVALSSFPVPGAGDGRVPEGARWLSFGQPATDLEGDLAFSARFVSAQGMQAGVFGPHLWTGSGAVALSGEPAPGFDEGAKFVAFNDPAVARFTPLAGDQAIYAVAFTAVVSGPGVSARDDMGLWTTATVDGSLQLILREGGLLPVQGLTTERVQGIQSFVLTRTGLWIVAQLAKGEGGVTRNDDVTLLFWDGASLQLHLREGWKQIVAGKSKAIRTLNELVVAGGSTGAVLGYDERKKGMLCRLTFTDGAQALTDGTTLIATNDPVGDATPGTRWARFGMPALADAGDGGQMLLAFAGEMRIGLGGVRPMNDRGIFVANTDEGIDRGAFLVRRNDPVPGLPGVRFASFKDPVISPDGDIAFAARLAERGVSEKSEALFWSSDDSLRMLAWQKALAPGAPDARIDRITAVALSGSEFSGKESAPVFEAKLRSGSVIVGDGLWAVDSKGEIQLVLRSGMDIDLGVERKSLNRFSMLRALNGSPAKGRALDAMGTSSVWGHSTTARRQFCESHFLE